MTRYWIVVENTHEGPFTAEELIEKNLPADTYAWHPGLSKWTRIKDIPEFSHLYTVEEPSVVQIEETQPAVPGAAERTTPPPPPAVSPVAPVEPQPVYIAATNEKEEKRPSSYLAWSIVTTILFFLPLGIVAIIFASKVNSQWVLGKREEARKSSELAAWFSNIAFVVGLIWIPFSITISMIAA